MKYRFLIFTTLFLGLFFNARATHNRAGEITFRALDTSSAMCLSYEITITTYTKGQSLADRCSLIIYFGDGDSAEFYRGNGPCGPNSFDIWNHNCPNACVGEKVNDKTKKNVYVGKHTFPGAGNYVMHVFDPNRNGGILNIPGSVNVPFYITTTLIINPFMGVNSSPVLLNPPIDNACTGQCFIHNPGAFDPDGDSLSYEMTVCLGENGSQVPGYSQPNGPGGGSLSLHPTIGDLVWCSPQVTGEYNAAFFIHEWRKVEGQYFLISTIERDMQIDVLPCNNKPPDILTINDTCVEAGTKIEFTVKATDPDGDVITLTAIGGPLSPFVVNPSASFNSSPGAGTTSGQFSWQTNCGHVRQQPYLVSFKAIDDDPQVPLVDFMSMNITVVAPAVTGLTAVPAGSTIIITWNPSVCPDVVGYKIYRKNNCSPWVHGPCETGVPPSSGYVLIGTTSGINSTTFTDDNNGLGLVQGVNYSYVVAIDFTDGAVSFASSNVCAKLLRDVPVITNVDVLTTSSTAGVMDVKWQKPLNGQFDLDTLNNPGPYEFRVMRATGFTPAASQFMQQTVVTSTYFAPISFISTYTDVNLLNTADSAYTYRIDFYCNGNFKGSTQTASSVYLSMSPGDNKLNLTWKEVVPWTNYQYYIMQEITPGSGIFNVIDSSTTPSKTVTGLINGVNYCFKIRSVGQYSDTSITHPLINHSEIKCGIPIDNEPPCAPQLNVTADCINSKNSLQWTNPNNTCADDVVQYKIYYKPIKDTAFQFITSVSGAGNTNTTHTYVFNKTTTIIGCYVITALDTLFNESVMSNVVCIDTCQIYELPNVFSPDGNSVNDFFIPVNVKYVKEIDFKIYDRWGVLVFQTTDPAIGWDGKNYQSGKICTEGTYYYVCVATMQSTDKPLVKSLKGFIQLLQSGSPFSK